MGSAEKGSSERVKGRMEWQEAYISYHSVRKDGMVREGLGIGTVWKLSCLHNCSLEGVLMNSHLGNKSLQVVLQ